MVIASWWVCLPLLDDYSFCNDSPFFYKSLLFTINNKGEYILSMGFPFTRYIRIYDDY